ncbi:unnamed protein product, partial [Closterium sp. NIES-53]
ACSTCHQSPLNASFPLLPFCQFPLQLRQLPLLRLSSNLASQHCYHRRTGPAINLLLMSPSPPLFPPLLPSPHLPPALRAELFINACDKPVSFDNSLSSGCSGFPVFSTQWTPGSTDILFPDPLDLDYSPPQHAEHVPWAKVRLFWRPLRCSSRLLGHVFFRLDSEFSTRWTPGSTDILFPDSLDLDYSPPQHTEHIPWAKVSRLHPLC